MRRCVRGADLVGSDLWVGSLFARRDIEKGEEITVGYLDTGMCREDRQKKLREAYLFDCKCERCEDPSDPPDRTPEFPTSGFISFD